MIATLAHLPWYWPVLGGLCIGTAAGMLLLFNGRILGVSGMTAASLGWADGHDRTATRLFLVASMAGAGLTYLMLHRPAVEPTANMAVLIVGGLLVGYGTRLGSGCTSGHGVCGLARLSPRSIAATGAFMCSAAITVYVVRHILGYVS